MYNIKNKKMRNNNAKKNYEKLRGNLYSYITSPESGLFYNINSKIGKNIIYKYLLRLKGGAGTDEVFNEDCQKLEELIRNLNTKLQTNHYEFFKELYNYINVTDELNSLLLSQATTLSEDNWINILNNFLLNEMSKVQIEDNYDLFCQDEASYNLINEFITSVIIAYENNPNIFNDFQEQDANSPLDPEAPPSSPINAEAPLPPEPGLAQAVLEEVDILYQQRLKLLKESIIKKNLKLCESRIPRKRIV